MRVQEEDRKRRTDEVQEEDHTENCFKSKPNSGNEDENFLELQCAKTPKALAMIPRTKTAMKNPNRSNPGLSIWGAKLIKPNPANVKADYIDNKACCPGVTATATDYVPTLGFFVVG
eukprot:CAMPEP_0168180818 /NCGR_PEP_ID=MMETSP0139_2-20121125/10793_1 /TAXON_ID=44445 /ORGANISM="Pseudo-nitzschia australis, Strain 10249 10 AB" /LENGTH=116 /DNA_ID=CAMNT_0008101167 /DNA_START=233 /DNA_END=580 /DNA_ORIENTATION=+